MEQVLEVKLKRWTRQGEAPEYYRLRNRGPYKPTVMSELNRFGGQMGPYVDALLPLRSVEYINASPIDNLGEGTPAFVATMCPKRSTFAHFWSMVWETGSQLIINLTHERDKVGSDAADKREQYWPPFDERMASEAACWPVRVRTLGCESCAQVPGLHRYALELVGPSAEKRIVALYWYSRWLDFPASSSIGSPPFLANAWNVLHVAVHVSHLLASALGEHHRSVCHCSAGVGRTGTLIALLHLLARLPALQTGDDFDACVRESIERMRERRLWMVKSDVEFALIYAAVLQRLKSPSDEVFSRPPPPALAPPPAARRRRAHADVPTHRAFCGQALTLRRPNSQCFAISWRPGDGDCSVLHTLLRCPGEGEPGPAVAPAWRSTRAGVNSEEVDNTRDVSHYGIFSHTTPPSTRLAK